MVSYLQLREQDRCSGRSSHCTHSLGGEDRALQADRQKDRRPWDPLTPLSTSHVVQLLSQLLGALFAHLGAGVVLASPDL